MKRDRQYQDSEEFWSEPQEMGSTKHRTHQDKYVCPLIRLINAYDQVFKNKQWMVCLGEANSKIDAKVVGQTHIISGPAQSGKSSLVYWALRNDGDQTAIVTVDCSLYRTQMQFIQKLTRQVGEKIGIVNLDKRAVASENIKFSQLNGAIIEKGRPVVFLIRNAERLVQFRKQILLYNLLQWIATDIKKYVGLVFTTRLIYFSDRFEKRVRSRLSAKQLTVLRPNVQTLIELLARRVQCLIEEEGISKQNKSLKIFQKLYRAIKQNKHLFEAIKKNQQFAQKDIVFYLNAMKLAISSFDSAQQILQMDDRHLKLSLSMKLTEGFQNIFPFMIKNLLKTCTFPQYMVMALIHYMGVHLRTPYRFRTVYDIYLEFKEKLVTSEGVGSSFIFSKNVLERAVIKLEQLKIFELDNKDESVWNCDIRCSIYPEDIKRAFQQMSDLPDFLNVILNS